MEKMNPIQTAFWRLFNGAARLLLRSPLHRVISGSVMLITFTGRKTGRVISTPVSYIREGQIVTLFTPSAWRKNLEGGALVRLLLGGREYSGWATPCANDPDAARRGLTRFLTLLPREAPFYKVRSGADGLPDAEQVAAAARRFTMIQIKLSSRGAS